MAKYWSDLSVSVPDAVGFWEELADSNDDESEVDGSLSSPFTFG